MACRVCFSVRVSAYAVFRASFRRFSSESGLPEQRESSVPQVIPAFYFHPSFRDEGMKKVVLETMTVRQNFISPAEEESLVAEVSPRLKRMVFELDHWDNVIFAYKETEWRSWRPENKVVLDRVRHAAFPADASLLPVTHVLELRRDGHINPHVDSVRFCGDTVAGLCCLSSSVMRFRHERRPDLVVDFLLPRRGLYVMTGAVRYDFTHEILRASESRLGDRVVPRDRRIAIISREPPRNRGEDG